MVFISQPTVCRIVAHISKILCSLLNQYVKFPLPGPESDAVHQAFYNISGMPEIIGCIDGTHVSINNPGGPYAEIYRNRKSYFSVNVQVKQVYIFRPQLITYIILFKYLIIGITTSQLLKNKAYFLPNSFISGCWRTKFRNFRHSCSLAWTGT